MLLCGTEQEEGAFLLAQMAQGFFRVSHNGRRAVTRSEWRWENNLLALIKKKKKECTQRRVVRQRERGESQTQTALAVSTQMYGTTSTANEQNSYSALAQGSQEGLVAAFLKLC